MDEEKFDSFLKLLIFPHTLIQGPAHDVQCVCGIPPVPPVCLPEGLLVQTEVPGGETGHGHHY